MMSLRIMAFANARRRCFLDTFVHGSASGAGRRQDPTDGAFTPIYPQCGGNSNGVVAQLAADLQPAVAHTLGPTAYCGRVRPSAASSDSPALPTRIRAQAASRWRRSGARAGKLAAQEWIKGKVPARFHKI